MKDEEILINLYRKENQAMVEKDLLSLNRILSDGMTLTHMTGYVQPKMEWIDQIQNDEMKYLSSTEVAIKDIRINQNKASLLGQNEVKASIWGSSVNTWRLQMQYYFEKIAGKWIITKQVASTF